MYSDTMYVCIVGSQGDVQLSNLENANVIKPSVFLMQLLLYYIQL